MTPRYFVDWFPLFVNRATGTFTYTYIDSGAVTLDSFGTHLRAHLGLLHAIQTFDFIYAAPSRRLFRAANKERPHKVLDMKYPAEVYRLSNRVCTGLPDIDYPFHDKTIVITLCGRICLGRKKIIFSTVLAGQAVGIKEVHKTSGWLALWIMIWDISIGKPECLNHSKIHSAHMCYLCSRYIL